MPLPRRRSTIRELLLQRADALDKNADGRMAHHLAELGTPARRMLKSELSWRLCLEEPQPCQLLPLGPHGEHLPDCPVLYF